MNSRIRFLRTNRYRRPVGSQDTDLGYGVHELLVMRGIAEFVHDVPLGVAAISEPQLSSEELSSERKSRRSSKKECV